MPVVHMQNAQRFWHFRFRFYFLVAGAGERSMDLRLAILTEKQLFL